MLHSFAAGSSLSILQKLSTSGRVRYLRFHCITICMLLCVCVCLENRESLGISSFGLSLTTMEEVFLKVGSGSTETSKKRYSVMYVCIYIYAGTEYTVS